MKNLIDIFSEFEVSSKTSKSLTVLDYVTVHGDDCEPVSIINPCIEKGPWIAGGAALKWYQDLPVEDSDIDVFCRNAVQAQQLIEQIKSYGRYHEKFSSDNAVTLSYYTNENTTKSWTIQIITRRYFSSLQEVIDNFDITVCQIGTCGTEWVLGPNTARDIRERNLRFNLPLQADSPKRLVKYWTYGYRPVEDTLNLIQQNPSTRWTYSLDEDYNNAF